MKTLKENEFNQLKDNQKTVIVIDHNAKPARIFSADDFKNLPDKDKEIKFLNSLVSQSRVKKPWMRLVFKKIPCSKFSVIESTEAIKYSVKNK